MKITHLYCMQRTACFLPKTACDYRKVGMSVKGRLVGTHRTHFHSHILRWEVKDPFENSHSSFSSLKFSVTLQHYLASFASCKYDEVGTWARYNLKDRVAAGYTVSQNIISPYSCVSIFSYTPMNYNTIAETPSSANAALYLLDV